MPYPNQHAARMLDPSAFVEGSFRTKAIAPGISIVVGKLKSNPAKMATQTYRFDKSKFTAAEARAWLKDHKVSPKSFEAAAA